MNEAQPLIESEVVYKGKVIYITRMMLKEPIMRTLKLLAVGWIGNGIKTNMIRQLSRSLVSQLKNILMPNQKIINQPKLKKALEEKGVVLCYLFGSYARGEEIEESDVDIGVLFDRSVDEKEYLEKEGELIGVFNEYFFGKEINIVTLNIAPPLLKQNVVVDGKVVYEFDVLTRVLFENRTLHEYEDYLHLDRIYNYFLSKRIKAL